MNFKLLPILALVASPVLAEERWHLDLGLNHRRSQTVSYLIGSQNYRFQRDPGSALSLQAGYRAWDFGQSDLAFTGEYQFNKSFNGSVTASGPTANGKGTGDLDIRYFAPGVQWTFHRTLDFGAGLQYRFTHLDDGLTPASNDRPWLNVQVGYTFRNAAKLKPHVALRLAAAVTSSRAPVLTAGGTSEDPRQMLRYLEGNSETSLRFGVRF